MIERPGLMMNHKKLSRLYREEGLSVCRSAAVAVENGRVAVAHRRIALASCRGSTSGP
ncbi:hypothetical protein EDF57_1162 [Novosphingobium sp. PhB55]|nr:hypothetical protein EDF57_1162 [Novosphingobium sp. PhB55]